MNYRSCFRIATRADHNQNGFDPMGWQCRRGLALAWLWNRVFLNKPDWPRRLVYCVPMRTLVEQTRERVPPLSDWDIVRAPEGEEDFSTKGVVTAVHVPLASAKTEKIRRIGLFFELTFDAPVAFPMPALGHSCHFGLGLFVPVPDA